MRIYVNSRKTAAPAFFALMLFVLSSTVVFAEDTTFEVKINEESFLYTVSQTGDNYTFKFNKIPDGDLAKLDAGYDVLQSVYEDSSIHKNHTESYRRERAQCYMFDSHFYTYTLCFFPNEFSKNKTARFWGFVTQLPNWLWLVTRVLLPVLLLFVLIYYVTQEKRYT